MPNWCYNKLVVIGPEDQLNEFQELVRDGDSVLTFQKIIPVPQDDNWYDNNREAWGTKWDAVNAHVYRRHPGDCDRHAVDESEGCITYTFDTAWSSPGHVLGTLSKMFPTLVLRHSGFEEGLGFAVTAVLYQGMWRVIYDGDRLGFDMLFEKDMKKLRELVEEDYKLNRQEYTSMNNKEEGQE
ncbi:MAG: DUF1281 family ferredoxin-like fold protein [Burkholderiales bacterium]